MTGGLYRLAGFCVRHRKVVVGFWIVLAIAITFLSTSLVKQFADNLSLPGRDSQQASDLVDAKFPSQANGSNPVLFKAKQGKITDSSDQMAVESTIKTLSADSEVASINDPFSADAPGQVSRQWKIAYASMLIKDGPGGGQRRDCQGPR